MRKKLVKNIAVVLACGLILTSVPNEANAKTQGDSRNFVLQTRDSDLQKTTKAVSLGAFIGALTSALPSALPTTVPTNLPTLNPSLIPTASVTPSPTVKPTITPSPTVKPTATATARPSGQSKPSLEPVDTLTNNNVDYDIGGDEIEDTDTSSNVSKDNVVKVTGKKFQAPGEACKDGKYIYYAYEMGGLRMGIMRYDTELKSKKEICSYKVKGEGSNGFYHLSVKGKYIYAEWDKAYGTDGSNGYIYRINKNNGNKKKITEGYSPVIKGNYIYYIKKVKVDSEHYSPSKEIYRIKLDGTGKKKVANTKVKFVSLAKYGDDIAYYTNEGKYYDIKGQRIKTDNISVTSNAYYSATNYCDEDYSYSVKNENTLYIKDNRTGKTKKLASFEAQNAIIESYRVCGKFLMVKLYEQSETNAHGLLYIVDVEQKEKKCLRKWQLAE